MTITANKIEAAVQHAKALDVTSRQKLSRLEKRWANAQYREALNPENLKRTHKSILKQLQAMRDKAIRKSSELKRAVPKEYIRALEQITRKVTRRHRSLLKTSISVSTLKSRLFQGLTSEQMEEKLQQLLRVPLDKFRGFNKLEEVDQESRFNALLEEFGQGSGNGGFSPALLNLPDHYHDSYMLSSCNESDGSKRRPQFIHEVLERLINAAIEPEKYKQIFFMKTEREVKKWGHNWRQIRSEGRFAMIKVMTVLMPYLDFRKSLRIGIRHKVTGEYRGISIAEIAERSGLSEDSVDAALRNLEKQGLLHPGTKQYMWYQASSGEMAIRGLATVRCMPSNLIVRLGLGERFVRERKATAADLPEEYKAILDDLDYAKLHPEQFTMKEVSFMSMFEDLYGSKTE